MQYAAIVKQNKISLPGVGIRNQRVEINHKPNISNFGYSDLPPNYVKHGVICGAVHHPGDTGEYPAFAKTPRPDDVSELDNEPVLVAGPF